MRTLGLAALLVAASATSGFCASYDDLNAGIAARNLGDSDGATAYFDKVLAAADAMPSMQYTAHLDRGEIRARKHDFDGAIADFSACLNLIPGDRTVLLNRAETFIRAGRSDAARQDADAILALDPNSTDAFFVRSESYESDGNIEAELKELKAVLSKYPKEDFASFKAGVAEFLLGFPDEAALSLTASFKAPARYPYRWLWLALANLKQGKTGSPDFRSNLDMTKWPGPIIDFFQGHGTEEAVNEAAAKGSPASQAGQLCEANFYLGEWRLQHKDSAGGRLLIQKAAEICPQGDVELNAAKVELKNAR